jgi:signal transduction histidine kinase
MSSARPDRHFRSTSFRLSAGFAGLLTIAFIAASAGIWWATKAAAEREIRERVALEMSALQREIRSEGLPAAIEAIRSRSESPGSLEYRLADASGRLLAGDQDLKAPSGWSTVDVVGRDEKPGGPENFIAFTARTNDGGELTIADDLDRAERVRVAVLGALAWVAGASLMLVLLLGVLLTRRTARRIQALSDTLDKAGRGDLAARAPEAGQDEIASIGRGVNDALARIAALVENLRRVSRDVAHDLRTPLTHVRQQLEAATKAGDENAIREGIRLAQLKIDDVLHIFQAILRLAEIDAGSARARFGPVDLSAVVERVADAYRPDIEAAGRRFIVSAPTPSPVRGDADLIAQALANLLENAMHHAPEGSTVRVEVSQSPSTPGFAVSDEGPGIPEADRARVLDPFVRLDSSRTTPGAGLGLSIVNAIARLHGARLTLSDARPGLRAAMEWTD